MIKYALTKNQLAKNKPNFVANISYMDSKNLDDLLNKMVEEGTGLTRPQAMAYFEKLTQSTISLLEDGCTVNTPLFRVRPTIKGVFETENDYFESEKQKLSYAMCAGNRLKPIPANMVLEKIKSSLPVILNYLDGMTKQTNSIITPGGIAGIKGENLQFNIDDPTQGVFFCSVQQPQTEIRALSFLKNTFKEISFLVPQLEAGKYTLKIRTCSNKNIQTSGILKQVLTVAQ